MCISYLLAVRVRDIAYIAYARILVWTPRSDQIANITRAMQCNAAWTCVMRRLCAPYVRGHRDVCVCVCGAGTQNFMRCHLMCSDAMEWCARGISSTMRAAEHWPLTKCAYTYYTQFSNRWNAKNARALGFCVVAEEMGYLYAAFDNCTCSYARNKEHHNDVLHLFNLQFDASKV